MIRYHRKRILFYNMGKDVWCDRLGENSRCTVAEEYINTSKYGAQDWRDGSGSDREKIWDDLLILNE